MRVETTLPALLARSGGALAERVRRTGAGLVALGLAPGERVAVYLEKGEEAVVALCAVACAGAVAVPVNPRLKDAQLAHLLADCTPRLVVTSATKIALLRAPEKVLAGTRLLRAGSEPLPGEEGTLAELAGDPEELPVPAPDDLAILLYTSGSTGLPKGVRQSHRSLVDGARIVSTVLGLTAADRVLAALPLSFDYGLNQVLSALWVGAEFLCADYLTAVGLMGTIEQSGITVLAGVPTLWHDLGELLRADPDRARSLGTLRIATNTGGPWDPRDIATLGALLPGLERYGMYGLTEAFRTTILRPPDRIDEHPDSIGTAVPEVEVLLVDPHSGVLIDGAGTGELVHAGALIADGYWNRPADTAARFRGDPRDPDRGTVVYSGDLVRRDREGLLYFVGRRDRQLKVDGYRVSPDELTEAARLVPGVREAVAFGLPDGVRGDRLVLCVTGGGAGLAEHVATHLCGELPRHLQPAAVRVLDSLPRTANGKIDFESLIVACSPPAP